MTMRYPAWIRSLGSVSAAIAVLAGCAGPAVDDVLRARDGGVLIRPGRPGFVVGTRGERDTIAVVTEVAQHTGYGLVVAPDASGDPASRAAQAYERGVVDAAQGPLRFYVEIDGHDGTPCAGQLAIAPIGVDRELALRLRALAELIRDAHLRVNHEVERLAVVLADAGGDAAAGVRRDGVLGRPERALHIELPRCGRRDWREMYGAILADFVAQAAVLPAGR